MTLSENPTYYRLTRNPLRGGDILYLLVVVLPGALMALSGEIGQAFGMLWSGSTHYLYLSVRAMFDSLRAVGKDIEGRAIDELFSSGVSGRQVVWAHLAASLRRRWLAFALTPLVALIFSGFLDLGDFLMILLLSAVLVPLYTALGMILAVTCQGSSKAQRWALGVVGMHYFGSLLLGWMSSTAAALGNPIFSSITLLNELGTTAQQNFMPACIVTHWVLAALAGWRAVEVLSNRHARPAERPSVVPRRHRYRRGWLFENPVLSRELKFEIPWLCPLLLVGPVMVCGADRGDGLQYGLWAVAAYLCLRAVSGAQASLDSEKQGRTLETLLSTPISSRQIVGAKALAVLLPLWAIEALLFPLVLVLTGPGQVMATVGLLLTLAAVLAALVCVQLAFATREIDGWGWLLAILLLPLAGAPFEVPAVAIGLAQPLVALGCVASEPSSALIYVPAYTLLAWRGCCEATRGLRFCR